MALSSRTPLLGLLGLGCEDTTMAELLNVFCISSASFSGEDSRRLEWQSVPQLLDLLAPHRLWPRDLKMRHWGLRWACWME